MKKSINTENKFLPIIFIIFLIFLWEVLAVKMNIPKYILPSPSLIIKALIREKAILFSHTKVTLYEGLLGYLISIVFGIFLALLMDRNKLIKNILYPLMVISQTVPIIALAPLIIVWFGFGTLPKIFIVMGVCFFPICVSMANGLENVDKELIEMMRVMKASNLQIFAKVKLPSSLPSLFSGLKISATYSIMGAVIAEWIGGQFGLGIHMTRSLRAYKTDALFANIIIVVIISISLFKLVELIETILIPWKK